MNILIIEDDLFLAKHIQKFFKKDFWVNIFKIVSNYKEFLREYSILNSYDLILVDILLGPKEEKTWLDIIQLIREKNQKTPVIVVSWYDEISYLEKAFLVWASDYIIKPFRLKELELRAQKWFSLYLYPNLSCYEEISYFWLSYNISKKEFYFNWELIELTKSSKYLLLLFLSNPESLLSETFLNEKIWWDISCIIDRNIRVNILRLKSILKKYNLDLRIKNIRWEWYMLIKD